MKHNAAGNRVQVTNLLGTWSYKYDATGRMVGLFAGEEAKGTAILTWAYDQNGYLKDNSFFSSSAVELKADVLGRVAQQKDTFAGNLGNVTFEMGYNPAGQLSSSSSTNDIYAYTGKYNVDRAYKANGLNQYLESASLKPAYDANGNLISDGKISYAYDAENRLIVAGEYTLQYDPLGRLFRISKDGYVEKEFLYDGDQLTSEFDGAGTLIDTYVHGAGNDDPLLWLADGMPLRWYHRNYQGSIIATALGKSGALDVNYTYDEAGIPGSRNKGRFQYTGQAWLPGLGMYFYKARFYSPTLGRFLQVDPVGYDDGLNLYSYIKNDPVNGSDPTGMYECVGSKAGCRAVADFAKGLDAAAGSNRLNGEQKAALRGASDALGVDHDGNGVTVRFGDLGKTSDGSLKLGVADASTNTITLNLDAVSQVAAKLGWKQAFVQAAGTMGHEIRHLMDGVIRGKDYNALIRTETNGYTISSFVNQAFGLQADNARQIQNRAINSCEASTGQRGNCENASLRLYPGSR